MTKEQQRIAIAEWMGFEEIHFRTLGEPDFVIIARKCWVGYFRFEDGSTGDDELEIVPNYPDDLNAMHEAEERLKPCKLR